MPAGSACQAESYRGQNLTSPHTAKPRRPLRPQSTIVSIQQMPKKMPAPADSRRLASRKAYIHTHIYLTCHEQLCRQSSQLCEDSIKHRQHIYPSMNRQKFCAGHHTAAALELVNHGEDASRPFAHHRRPNESPSSQPNVHGRQQEEPCPPANILCFASLQPFFCP